ncbi:MAG: hypothetical protein CMH83_03405 [Nocardioides sp.]|nr:hypothetical protein [Nocardioides sp.]
MTTDTRREARPVGAPALGAALTASGAVLAVVSLVGLASAGLAGLLGALAGGAVTLLVLASGFAAVDLVAAARPAFSLVVALLTYTLHVVVLAAVLVAASRSEGLSDVLSPSWLAAAAVGVSAVWTVAQLRVATRARIPAYDVVLPGERGVRDGRH